MDTPYDTWAFCGGGPEADVLAELVLSRQKTATASWLDSYRAEGEMLPLAGAYSVILYDNGQAACVIQNDRVDVVPFYEVPASHAMLEGEGDKSLGNWRSVHTQLFQAECAELGIPFHREHEVVLEQFHMVYPIVG